MFKTLEQESGRPGLVRLLGTLINLENVFVELEDTFFVLF